MSNPNSLPFNGDTGWFYIGRYSQKNYYSFLLSFVIMVNYFLHIYTSKAIDSPTGNVALPMPGDNAVLSTPTDPGCATFQFAEADTFDSLKTSINRSLSGILNAAKTIDDHPMAHDPTENPQNNDSYPYPYQLGIFDMEMHIDSDDGSQLSQSNYEELSSFSATNHASQPSIVPDANTLSTKGKDRAEPQISRVRSMEQIDFQAWKLFQEYTVRLRNLMVERAVQNTVINHKYFFYLSSLLYLDYLHKQYLTAFKGGPYQL
ncbi:hypothetical protein M422DRAFT_57020 [Sphaerobolus stellatus SS14]|uniref:Uncharacterized protein n=1 Tax=Sphaerobolus stellatus (strain SS14) TaxID=990650 RepID=A0A0C9UBW4_SPHS4|nr:hypothetical protein M422DRAFT_57020 [Sphaerobolus stellatus SS14]